MFLKNCIAATAALVLANGVALAQDEAQNLDDVLDQAEKSAEQALQEGEEAVEDMAENMDAAADEMAGDAEGAAAEAGQAAEVADEAAEGEAGAAVAQAGDGSGQAIAIAESPFSYTYFGAGYVIGDINGEDDSGYQVYGSYAVTNSVFIQARFTSLESDDKLTIGSVSDERSIDEYRVGVGVNVPVRDSVDAIASVAYFDAETEFGASETDTDGYGISAGLRAMRGDKLELNASLTHIDTEADNDTELLLGGRYYQTPKLSFGISYDRSDDDGVDRYLLDARMNF